jgi:CheY-like chemotaxis protein
MFRIHPDQFDVVFTDQTMPRMTGVQLSLELLKIRSDLPIILATGYSSAISKEKAKSLGIREFVMKPIKAKMLIHLIRELLK